VSQELDDILAWRAVAQGGWSFGAEGVDGGEILLKPVAIEEEQGIKGLVLGAGRDTFQGQAGEEILDLLFWGSWRIEFGSLEERGIADEPVEVRFLGVDGEVFTGASLSQQASCVVDLHK
jgi:hypothetical protein